MLKIGKILSKIAGGTNNERTLKEIEPIVAQINEFAQEYKAYSDDELKAKTNEFRYRLRMGDTLDDILPEAFAVVKDTCRRLCGKSWAVRGQQVEWNMVPYDVQLVGGIVLHQGKIAEMKTGEGKTLVASMPLYLNALEGKGAHLITVNDYLAQRDAEWMGEIYKFLGLTVAAIYGQQDPQERKTAYQADITYGTNNEFGFDYLRDNMTSDVWSVVQRPLHYAIVDEVDSVLIDEARTPLIISGSVGAPRNIYNELRPTVENLYKKQKELITRLFKEGKDLLEKDEEQAGLKILRVQRGDPKNPELMSLLTSEFWVKKLIEKIQGQFEINKEMGRVDQELYYTIDEKSHVLDITEKGRIFLSGGRDQDVAHKIQQLDELDEVVSARGEEKGAARYFDQDQISGRCQGLTLQGKMALLGISADLSNEQEKALEKLNDKLAGIAQESQNAPTANKVDRSQVWRKYFKLAKKMDKGVNAMSQDGITLLSKDESEDFVNWVKVFDQVLQVIRSEADVDAGLHASRVQLDRRRNLTNTFFETDKQYGCPIGLKQDGKLAILAALLGGNPLRVPQITELDRMLHQVADDPGQEYFEFSDDGAVLKHIAEKGRIALLGGNPDLYVLPDRSIVEERDRQLQQILDKTLNQSTFDYAARVNEILRLENDIAGLYASTASLDLANYYKVTPEDEYMAARIELTENGLALLSDFAAQTREIVDQFDKDIKKNKSQLDNIFEIENEQIVGLAKSELDALLGANFDEIRDAIEKWKTQNLSAEQSFVERRIGLDAALGVETGKSSLSRRFEEVSRIAYVVQSVFSALSKQEISKTEKKRIIRRYFDLDVLSGDIDNTATLPYNGLSNTGVMRFIGSAYERNEITNTLLDLLENTEIDAVALFELDENSYPAALQTSVRSQLLNGLPFYSYTEELKKFRDEILQLGAKKVNSNKELQNVLPKDKTHLRSKGIALDEREMNELIANAHHPSHRMHEEEIEHWFRIHFNRKPRKLLENQRDKLWQDYQDVEERVQNISQLLRAFTLYQKDVDYVVKTPDENERRRTGASKGKAVMIVDQFTGRLMPGRRFSDGLHEALEAKEGVQVQAESQTLATITLQNFFRIYEKLAGMTGTAETEAQEFYSTYNLDTVVIPTNRPVVREDNQDVIFRTRNEKYQAIIDEALEMHEKGRPVLIGTISVDVSQHLSNLFTRRGIPVANWLKRGDVNKELESGKFHTVLNAKYHKQEAEIVAKAGLPGAITIATNMAGRGTDIKLAESVRSAGGLHIVGSEKHESRRIDNQLRGRSGRQGDSGSSRFYLSLEDDLMRLFGSDRITNIMSRMGSMDDGERIEHSLITKSIERAQKKVEERNFEIRKHLLEYDDVLNEQRKIIYKRRQNLLGFAQVEDFVESKLKRYIPDEDDKGGWETETLLENLAQIFQVSPDFTVDDLVTRRGDDIRELLTEWISTQLVHQRHFEQLHERHRMWGFVEPSDVIANLVRLKIRLHDAGSSDTFRWNVEGIRFELDRIFAAAPEWLPESAEKLDTADRLEAKLIEWAQQLYAERVQTHQDAFDKILFKQISHDEFVNVVVQAFVKEYLPDEMPAIQWNTDGFLRAVEHVFGQVPPIGTNEIRSIRTERVVEKIREWIEALPELDDEKMRHRVFGVVKPADFAAALLRFWLADHDIDELKSVPQDVVQKAETMLGFTPDIRFDEKEERPLVQLIHQARRAFTDMAQENIKAYDEPMLMRADAIELIEAVLYTIADLVVNVATVEQAQKELAKLLDFIFFDKSDIKIPVGENATVIANFKEDLVSWGHAFYKVYSEQQMRIEQERLSSEIVYDSVLSSIDDTIYASIKSIIGNNESLSINDIRRLESECRLIFRQAPRLTDDNQDGIDPNLVLEETSKWAKQLYQQRVQEIGKNRATRFERYYILEKIDFNWRQHLHGIDELREGIGLRGYGQKDPLLEYKREAFSMFERTIDSINREIVSTLFKVFDIGGEIEEQQMRRIEPASFTTSHSQVQNFPAGGKAPAKAQQPGRPVAPKTIVKDKKVGRNDPCPCGSGKKYKKCCGQDS